MGIKCLPLALCALLLFSLPSTAQTLASGQVPATQSPETSQQREARQELEAQALKLLDSVVAESQTLRLIENRALVKAVAADLLWTRNEDRARTLFKEAIGNFGELSGSNSLQRREANWSVWQLRREILGLVARRDPQLALDLLRNTTQPSQTGSLNEPPDEDLRLEQSLLTQIAANDPKRLLRLAEESLSNGISHELLNVLLRLKEKDPEAALKFTSSIIEKLKSTNLTANAEAGDVAVTLLRMGIASRSRNPVPARDGSTVTGVSQVKSFELTDSTISDLMGIVTAASLSDTGNNLLWALRSMLPEVERYAPTRVAPLRRRLAEFNRTFDPRARLLAEQQTLMETGTVDALLDTAATAPSEMKEMFYQGAAWKAVGEGDAERALQILRDNVKDLRARESLQSMIDRRLVEQALGRGKFEEARRITSQIESTEERAIALARLATMAMDRHEREFALKLLNEAQESVVGRAKNYAQLNAQLEIARAYSIVEPARSFEMLEGIITQVDEMLSAAAILEGFLGGQEIFRDGELVVPLGASSGIINNQYGKELLTLARADFARTRRLANRFSRTDAQLFARLLLLQAVLSSNTTTKDRPPMR